MSLWASTADFVGAIIQPTTYRLKLSKMIERSPYEHFLEP
jgi:hypothetical protein